MADSSGCAEAWVVDLKLSDLVYNYSCIQKFVSKEFERLTRSTQQSLLASGFTTIDISRFTASNLLIWQASPVATYLHFVLRKTDGGLMGAWLLVLSDVQKTWRSKNGKPVLSMRQNGLVRKQYH